MRETQFKVLMHYGQYVDTNLLQKGIYSTSTPILYSKETTIDLLVKSGKLMRDITGSQFIKESYFDNLKLCKLEDVSLVGQI